MPSALAVQVIAFGGCSPPAPLGAGQRRCYELLHAAMSEFSRYLLVRQPPEAVIPALVAARATAIVVEDQAPWTRVLPEDDDLLKRVPFPCALVFDFAEDHGVTLELFVNGSYKARLLAANEVGRRVRFTAEPWIEAGLLSREEATSLATFLKTQDWSHAAVRSRVAQLFGFLDEAWISYRYLTLDDSHAYELGDATWLKEGVPVQRIPEEDALDDASIEAILRAEAAAPKHEPATPPSNPVTPDLIQTFADVDAALTRPPKATAPVQLVDHVDLDACTSAREWLDARKRIDPRRASEEVLAMLERTVREGRFAGEGDLGLVVREAAAMLFARCLKDRDPDRARALADRGRASADADARAAWGIFASVAGIAPAS